MRSLSVWFLSLGLVAVSALPAAAQNVKLGTIAPKDSPWHQIILDMGERWKKDTGGAVTLTVYAGGVAGDDTAMVRKMRIGQLHAGVLTSMGLAAIVPEVAVMHLPRLLRSDAELDHIWTYLGPRWAGKLEQAGFKLLNWGEGGWSHFFSQQAVTVPDDLKRCKVLVWASSDASRVMDAWKKRGCRPVTLPVNEIHTGLQTGLIDTILTPPPSALAFQWFGQAKHMTALPVAPVVGATVMTLKQWERITPEHQKAVLAAAAQAQEDTRKRIRGLGAEAIEAMRKHGLEVHPVTAEQEAAWQAFSEQGYEELRGHTIPKELVDEIRTRLAAFRAQQAQGAPHEPRQE